MSQEVIIDIAQRAIYSCLSISGPVLLASFVVGIIMSFLQAVFQIHEYTFSFVPKLLAIFASIIFFAPWMLSEVVKLTSVFLGEGYKFLQ